MSTKTDTTSHELSTLPKVYDSKSVETKWYDVWENAGKFKPRAGKTKKNFCIIMPPPNVTGKLHMGHALDATTQDILTRFKRMKGFKTLWLPGTDHAGIATQSVVEKLVWEQEKKKRHDFTREEFLKKIWEWKHKYGDLIVKQQKALGASADWNYATFTMDPEANEAVNEAFVRLYNEGLIYQDNYIINWCPVLQSAISDAEVEHKEVKGAFYHIQYKVKNSPETLTVATTRPETMFGDTAVAVNPNDDRFKHLIGKTAIIPICNREVPIIGDEYVDMELGTGCLKVTPAHDFNDFEIGKRHKLPQINILNKDGTLNGEALEFKGLPTKIARKKVAEKLAELNQLLEVKDYVHQVGHCERTGAVIEPMISKQWFLNVTDMASVAVEKVKSDESKFYPKNWENTYFAWLNNPKNWCISRQLWWGHQIPVFYCSDCNHQFADKNKATECKKCKSKNIQQDPDVLDTWFSSGLWPFSTLGWPDQERMKKREFEDFFPTSVLVTGFDIIFFWVARMMMMSLKLTNKIPFEKIYIHALVNDKLGRKMSKSLGNGVDPLDMIDQYGADALRFTLAAGSGYNRNLNLDPKRIEGFRNFINKIWNAFRFIEPFLGLGKNELPKTSELTHHDKFILTELNEVIKTINESTEEFRFDDASLSIYQFVYDKFCSWYIELSKNIFNGTDETAKANRASILKYCFREIVKLIHPTTPYISEEIWGYLKDKNEDLLIVQEYPEYNNLFTFNEDVETMRNFMEITTLVRNLRLSVNIKPKDEVELYFYCDDPKIKKYFENNFNYLQDLAKVKKVNFLPTTSERVKKSIMSATSFAEIFIPLEGVIDLEDQKKRIQKEIDKNEGDLKGFDAKLKNDNFVKNAPSEVLAEVQEKYNDCKSKLESLKNNLKMF